MKDGTSQLSRIIFIGDMSCDISQLVRAFCHKELNSNGLFSFGTLDIGIDKQLQLVRLDGLEKLISYQSVLEDSTIGIVLLLDQSNRHSLNILSQCVAKCGGLISHTALAVGLIAKDKIPVFSQASVNRKLAELDLVIPVFEIGLSSHHDVNLLLQALLYSAQHQSLKIS